MTRSDAILHAIRRQVDKRRGMLDMAKDLRHVTIELRFEHGSDRVTPYEAIIRIEEGERETR